MDSNDPNYRYATNTYTADGVTTDWQINFAGGYISQADVYAYSVLTTESGQDSDRVTHALTFVSESGTNAVVRISPAVAVNRRIVIYRNTQKTESLVDYTDGSVITEDNLDLANKQATFNAAEFFDQMNEVSDTAQRAYDIASALVDPDVDNLQFLATKAEMNFADSQVASASATGDAALLANINALKASPSTYFPNGSITDAKILSMDDAKVAVHFAESGRSSQTLDSWITRRAKFTDFAGWDSADCAAAVAAAEASGFVDIDLQGGTFGASTANLGITKNYYNGKLSLRNPAGNASVLAPKISLPDTALFHNRDKSPLASWAGKKVLWLGTSIPHQGAGINSFPELAAADLGFTVNNLAWSSSHASYNRLADPHVLANMLALSMTRDDVAAGFAQYGAGSIYDPNFDPISKPDLMTCDYRIQDQMVTNGPYDIVVLDHAHNDQQQPIGDYAVEAHNITATTVGAVTTFTLDSTGTLAVGDSVIVGSPSLKFNYCARRVQAVSGGQVQINFNSTGMGAESMAGATLTKVDRNTLRGSFNFLRCYIYHTTFTKVAAAYPIIVLAGAPSDYSFSGQPQDLRAVNRAVRDIAVNFGLAYFDVAQSYDVQQRQQQVYFEDGTHPTTQTTRQLLANQWTRWMQGGANRQVGTTGFVTKQSGVGYTENATLVYDGILDNWVPRAALWGAITGIYGDTFTTNTIGTAWTASGAVFYNATAQAVDITYTVGGAVASILKAFTMNGTLQFSFTVKIPAGAIHTGGGVGQITLMSLDASDGVFMSLGLQATSGANSYTLTLSYTNASGVVTSIPVSGSYAAGSTVAFQLNTRKGTAISVGSVKLLVNGAVAAQAVVNNATRADPTQVRLGVLFCNMNISNIWQFDSFSYFLGTISSLATKFTGSTTFGTKTVGIVDGIIVSVV